MPDAGRPEVSVGTSVEAFEGELSVICRTDRSEGDPICGLCKMAGGRNRPSWPWLCGYLKSAFRVKSATLVVDADTKVAAHVAATFASK